jgi:hypothetical protein
MTRSQLQDDLKKTAIERPAVFSSSKFGGKLGAARLPNRLAAISLRQALRLTGF